MCAVILTDAQAPSADGAPKAEGEPKAGAGADATPRAEGAPNTEAGAGATPKPPKEESVWGEGVPKDVLCGEAASALPKTFEATEEAPNALVDGAEATPNAFAGEEPNGLTGGV